MVGLLGCGCCEKCCPDGNVWSYNYHPQTLRWPIDRFFGTGLTATPSGLEFRSPAPYTNPTGFNTLVQRIESVRNEVDGTDPPIKMGFGKLDLRNLSHKLTVPTRQEFEAWQPRSLAAFPNTTRVESMQLIVSLGLAVRETDINGIGYSFGLEFEWTKSHGWRNGQMYFDYKLVVSGWSGNKNFAFKAKSKIKTYGPSSSVFAMYFAGDFVSNQLDLKSDTNGSPAAYDCTKYKFGGATQETSDNLLVDPWTYYVQGTSIVERLYCFPYYQVEVTWKPGDGSSGLASHSFANTRVMLQQTDWKYGNRLNL